MKLAHIIGTLAIKKLRESKTTIAGNPNDITNHSRRANQSLYLAMREDKLMMFKSWTQTGTQYSADLTTDPDLYTWYAYMRTLISPRILFDVRYAISKSRLKPLEIIDTQIIFTACMREQSYLF